jgi:hypothetical protein
VYGDFNGDGFDDLAVGVPDEDVGDISNAGAVYVTLGSRSGLDESSSSVWHQDNWTIQGAIQDNAEPYDGFGSALAAGDFNGDGYLDLAIGVPGEDLGAGPENAGAVNVLYGSPTGLSSDRNQFWHQNSQTLLSGFVHKVDGTSEPGDRFGFSLAAGDFNGDGRDDLAVGVPGEEVSGYEEAGAVNILYGRSGFFGLSAQSDQLWHQNSPGIEGSVETDDQFGRALAAGDLNGDGIDDLAIGVPYEDIGSIEDAGGVNVIYGRLSYSGLTSEGNQFWSQDGLLSHPSDWVPGEPEKHDKFGWSLAIGNFNGDVSEFGYPLEDLAVGVPGEDIEHTLSDDNGAGAVNVLYAANSELGLWHTGAQFWSQDTDGIEGGAEDDDEFGRSLTAGDFNGDGKADLAIGVPGEDLGEPDCDWGTGCIGDAGAPYYQAGAVHILLGDPGTVAGGLKSHAAMLHQNLSGTEGMAEDGDYFGVALAAGNFDGVGGTDLAVVVRPGADIGWLDDPRDPDAVHAFYFFPVSASHINASDEYWWYDVPMTGGPFPPFNGASPGSSKLAVRDITWAIPRTEMPVGIGTSPGSNRLSVETAGHFQQETAARPDLTMLAQGSTSVQGGSAAATASPVAQPGASDATDRLGQKPRGRAVSVAAHGSLGTRPWPMEIAALDHVLAMLTTADKTGLRNTRASS